MECVRKSFMLCTFCAVLHTVKLHSVNPSIKDIRHHPATVSNYRTFKPQLYHGHDEKVVSSTNVTRKREAEVIRGPYNANNRSRYVELVLVVDNKLYKDLGSNLTAVSQYCKEIVNIVNAIYVPLNIFIALVDLVVWTENDEIKLGGDAQEALTQFLKYRRNKLLPGIPNDNAHLLTRVQFDGGAVGKSLKGPICTYEYSGGITVDFGSAAVTARQVAHQLGHNFGMEHDIRDCKCADKLCIMSPKFQNKPVTEWSSCSLVYLLMAFDQGMDYCLRNKPASLVDGAVCGNGFVEPGEECDCGLQDSCDNPCCDASTCTLHSNAACATGECCDLQTCQIRAAGTTCRPAGRECDLAEYCTGQSEYCPDDVFKMDGEICDGGKAYCYQGDCRSHLEQCRLLWGPSGHNSDGCYQLNTAGNRHGNCGHDMLSQTYQKCNNEDVNCGMLHCMHNAERLMFGLERVAILSHSFINSNGRIFACRTARIDLGLTDMDPGLVPNGAKCGDGKMCVNQHCVDAVSLRGNVTCPQNCNGNGVCNSRGHCHCKPGFAPPLCDKPGSGGSEDSGPMSVESKDSGAMSVESKDTSLEHKASPNGDLITRVVNNYRSNKNNLLDKAWEAVAQEFRSDIDTSVKKFLDKIKISLPAPLVSNSTTNDD